MVDSLHMNIPVPCGFMAGECDISQKIPFMISTRFHQNQHFSFWRLIAWDKLCHPLLPNNLTQTASKVSKQEKLLSGTEILIYIYININMNKNIKIIIKKKQ
jgi:hypothetical protein